MKYLIVLLLSVVLFNSIISAQNVVPIADIKINDSNGVPLDTGKVFTISGIVNSSNQFGNNGPGTVQDETAGLSIFGSGFSNQVNIGDSVTVTSVLSQFSGLTEFNFFGAGSSLINHGPASTNYEPVVVTISQVINQQWNGFEEFESLLIRINNVTIQASGNFTSGTNYTISDVTGTLTNGLRIDNDVSSIIGQAIPSGEVDLIGISGQFKQNTPYNSGYQLLPRSIFDIVSDGAPLVLNPVIAANIDTNSFTVYFNTARNGNSQVKYGLTAALELDSVVIGTDTTIHVVPITDLQESTLYYFRAYSTNTIGTSMSALQTVTTASSNPTIGTINVYFNFSVDTTVAIPGNAAKGNVNFEQKLMERINSANYSIDLSLYSFFGMQNIADAIIAARDRGVKVRVVYDSRPTQNSMLALINAGILVLKRPSFLMGIMHNKFIIFDARDSILTNDWLWTGSWNVTSTELNWKNNVIEINDPSLTAAYQIEFEEMWGSSGETPNSSNAKFGNQKIDNTTHSFNIGGIDVRLYFSPSDGTTAQIISAINSADDDIYFAMLAFTRSDIASAMFNKFDSGITDIRGIIEDPNTTGSQYNFLDSFAEMYEASSPTLHHKYGIVDASLSESDPTTITGSHNWSNSAETRNDENTLIINDVFIANQFMQEFKRRYNEAGGTGTFIIPVTSTDDYEITEFDYQLYQNYPNPFNPVTTIRFEIPYQQNVELGIYDILGREVKMLYDGIAPAGIMVIDFNAQGFSSGVYIYRLKTDEFISSKKFVMLK
jgi:phosphatidylserine/phosphatidylglycerophosphate/cardiolipin synthase-like enzyme